jgi:hypothetical protein
VKSWAEVEALLEKVMPLAERERRGVRCVNANHILWVDGNLTSTTPTAEQVSVVWTADGTQDNLGTAPNPANRASGLTPERRAKFEAQLRDIAIYESIRMSHEQTMASLTDLDLKVRLLSLNIYKLINKYAQFRLKLRSFFYRYFFKPFF